MASSRIVLAGALAITVIAPGAVVAVAQAPAPPSGNFGGGSAPSATRPIGGAGSALVSLRVGGSRVQVTTFVGARCTGASFYGSYALRADGSFSGRGSRRVRGNRVTVTSTRRISGTVAGAAASGTIRVDSRVVRSGRNAQTCSSGTVRWTARRPSGDLGAPGAVAGAQLYGTTSQRDGGPRESITLRVSRDGRKLSRAFYRFSFRCGRHVEDGYLDTPRPRLPIAADGTFADTQHQVYRFEREISYVTERFAGTIGASGARGTLSLSARTASRASGRTTGRCRTGTVRWSASV